MLCSPLRIYYITNNIDELHSITVEFQKLPWRHALKLFPRVVLKMSVWICDIVGLSNWAVIFPAYKGHRKKICRENRTIRKACHSYVALCLYFLIIIKPLIAFSIKKMGQSHCSYSAKEQAEILGTKRNCALPQCKKENQLPLSLPNEGNICKKWLNCIFVVVLEDFSPNLVLCLTYFTEDISLTWSYIRLTLLNSSSCFCIPIVRQKVPAPDYK